MKLCFIVFYKLHCLSRHILETVCLQKLYHCIKIMSIDLDGKHVAGHLIDLRNREPVAVRILHAKAGTLVSLTFFFS